MTTAELRLELWFANQDALVDHLGVSEPLQKRYLPASGDSEKHNAVKQHALTVLLEDRLRSDPPPELQRLLLASAPALGQVVAVEQAIYFRKQLLDRKIHSHAKLNTDTSWQFEGVVDPSRFPFASTHDYLSGRQSVFVVATVKSVGKGIVGLRPLFIGHRTWVNSNRHDSQQTDERRVHAMDVDHFSAVDWSTAPTAAEMKLMNNMREDAVKTALAAIIGVPFVPKDWGGERSDLSTNNLLVRGVQTSASWLLKGRSVQGPMKLAHLGANGDQIERLTTEASELIVVQHNNSITAPVVNMAKAFAYDMRNPRRFMIMDGHVTAVILRDYHHLK